MNDRSLEDLGMVTAIAIAVILVVVGIAAGLGYL
jgi:hypothetical protein